MAAQRPRRPRKQLIGAARARGEGPQILRPGRRRRPARARALQRGARRRRRGRQRLGRTRGLLVDLLEGRLLAPETERLPEMVEDTAIGPPLRPLPGLAPPVVLRARRRVHLGDPVRHQAQIGHDLIEVVQLSGAVGREQRRVVAPEVRQGVRPQRRTGPALPLQGRGRRPESRLKIGRDREVVLDIRHALESVEVGILQAHATTTPRLRESSAVTLATPRPRTPRSETNATHRPRSAHRPGGGRTGTPSARTARDSSAGASRGWAVAVDHRGRGGGALGR